MVDQKQVLEEISPAAESHGPMKRLYHWVLHWAETPYGTPALFLLSFAESSFFPVPPDVLQIALSVSKPKRSFFYATVSGIGSVLGGIVGWVIGAVFWAAVGWFFIRYVPGCSEENLQYVEKLYKEWGFWALLGAAFTPHPLQGLHHFGRHVRHFPVDLGRRLVDRPFCPILSGGNLHLLLRPKCQAAS